jgi:NTE family protein
MTMSTAAAAAIDRIATTTQKPSATVKQDAAKGALRLATRIHTQMKDERLVLTLSGGAPHSPLMAGALCALHETLGDELNDGKKYFDAIYTAGGGALVGLLLVAPKGGDAPTALRKMVKMGIADPIYNMVPLAYKVFVKPGPLVPFFQEWGELFKRSTSHLRFFRATVTTFLKLWGGPSVAKQPQYCQQFGPDDPDRRLFEDWVDLVFTALAPSSLAPWSTGLCEIAPYLEDLVDFDFLKKKYKGRFYLNAFNLSTQQEERFTLHQIDATHVRAALAYPFIYPPGKIGDDLYSEGASHDPVLLPQARDLLFPDGIEDPLSSLWFTAMEKDFTRHLKKKLKEKPLKPNGTIVCVDILGSLGKSVLRKPRDLWDAYGLSMIAPIVELAQKDSARFREIDNQRLFMSWYEQLDMPYDFKDVRPKILNWSYSNLSDMWDLGYKAGIQLCEDNGDRLRRPRHAL